jgi:16S rRNA processing protein RimM
MSSRRKSDPATPDDGATTEAAATDDWVAIGDIVGAFGVRGELKVVPMTDFPERFAETPIVYVGDKRRPYRVEGAHRHKQLVLLRLEGVADLDAAEPLRGTRIWIPAEQIRPLPAGSFYVHDLIGLRVQHVDGRPLGTIMDVLTDGPIDLYVVGDTPSGSEVLLPAVREFVKAIDLERGLVLVEPIPGLFDDQFEEAR